MLCKSEVRMTLTIILMLCSCTHSLTHTHFHIHTHTHTLTISEKQESRNGTTWAQKKNERWTRRQCSAQKKEALDEILPKYIYIYKAYGINQPDVFSVGMTNFRIIINERPNDSKCDLLTAHSLWLTTHSAPLYAIRFDRTKASQKQKRVKHFRKIFTTVAEIRTMAMRTTTMANHKKKKKKRKRRRSTTNIIICFSFFAIVFGLSIFFSFFLWKEMILCEAQLCMKNCVAAVSFNTTRSVYKWC